MCEMVLPWLCLYAFIQEAPHKDYCVFFFRNIDLHVVQKPGELRDLT